MGGFREYILRSGTKILLGKNAENNDELMKLFKGKENTILHTVAPGSPFCVILKESPSKAEIKEAGIVCAARSQAWRDTRKDVEMHVFTGKDIKKPFFAKKGTWKIKKPPKKIIIKKREIEKWLQSHACK